MRGILLMIPVLALVFLTGCGDNQTAQPLVIRDEAGNLVAIVGTWSGCEDVGGGNSELTVLNFSGAGGAFVNTAFTGSTDCTSGAQTPDNGTFSIATAGDTSVPWDGAGVPAGLNNPITATKGTLTLVMPGVGQASLKSVFVVNASSSPNVMYSKSDDDGGPLDGDGFPADITQAKSLTKQ